MLHFCLLHPSVGQHQVCDSLSRNKIADEPSNVSISLHKGILLETVGTSVEATSL